MKTKTRILFIEHDKYDVEPTQYELKKNGINYVSEVVQNEREFTTAMENFNPDIILSDHTLPSFSGLAAFEIKKEIAPSTPFIFVSGTIGEEKSIELIKNGVTDYVLKDKLFTLSFKVKRALKEAEDTKQKKLAEHLKEFDRNNINALINNTDDLMWSVDKDFKLISSNHPFQELIMHKSGGSIKSGNAIPPANFSQEQLNRYKSFYERCFAGETFKAYEFIGTPVKSWLENSFSPIHKGNEIIGAACYSRNVTERRLAELKLEEQNNKLLKVNSELDHFVYTASHDLRSPLSSVLGLVDLIEKETKEPDTILCANMIKSSIIHLDDFIKNILNYSQNNRTELSVEIIPLQKTATEIVGSLCNIPGAEGINFEININEQQPFYSDMHRFRTILENLISNGIKYHTKDIAGRYIKITGKSDMENLYLCIEDNGIGIASIYHNKVFDMFFRLQSETSGTGIGLYIVKETIEKLQGSIEMDSKEGRGTSFLIKLKNLSPASESNRLKHST